MIKAFYEQIADVDTVGGIIDYINADAQFQGVVQEHKGREYQKVYVNKPPAGSIAETAAINAILEINKDYYQYDLFGTFEVQILKYLTGCKYDWHCDYGVSENVAGDRKLSLSMQLSAPWDYRGGELALRDWHNRDTYASSEMGNTIVFDSRVPHKVNPITVGERYAIVAWAHGPQLR